MCSALSRWRVKRAETSSLWSTTSSYPRSRRNRTASSAELATTFSVTLRPSGRRTVARYSGIARSIAGRRTLTGNRNIPANSLRVS